MLSDFLNIDPFTWPQIGAAILCGFIIGFERQLRGKPAGIRTSSLIILGTYVFVTASFFVATDETDPSRIIGQVVTGIGFLGAGVMLSRDGIVRAPLNNSMVALRSLKRSYARRVSPLMVVPLARSATPQMGA